jgi:DNA-binding NtrC family response regulator
MNSQVPDSGSSKRSARVMIVEDDPGVSYAVSRWLQEQNVKSVVAESTHEALNMLRDVVFIESTFDGLLVDYNLPDATGMRVIQEFREEFPTVPVALMTGNVNIYMELWLRARNIPLFRKPLELVSLQAWVESLKGVAKVAK